MAKDNRKIHSGVRLGGTTYADGMEDELAKAATAKQLKRLEEKGAISGNWSSSAVVEEPVEDDDSEDAEEVEEVDDVEEEDEVAAAKPAAKKTASKKPAAKKR